MHAKATFLGKIGDREAAAAAFKETEEKTASGGSKADMVFSQIRCAGCLGLARAFAGHLQLVVGASGSSRWPAACLRGQRKWRSAQVLLEWSLPVLTWPLPSAAYGACMYQCLEGM